MSVKAFLACIKKILRWIGTDPANVGWVVYDDGKKPSAGMGYLAHELALIQELSFEDIVILNVNSPPRRGDGLLPSLASYG
jgi:hypothetical protein